MEVQFLQPLAVELLHPSLQRFPDKRRLHPCSQAQTCRSVLKFVAFTVCSQTLQELMLLLRAGADGTRRPRGRA